MPNWRSLPFMTDKKVPYCYNANHTTAYHNYIIVFGVLHRMLEATASTKSWYLSNKVRWR